MYDHQAVIGRADDAAAATTHALAEHAKAVLQTASLALDLELNRSLAWIGGIGEVAGPWWGSVTLVTAIRVHATAGSTGQQLAISHANRP